MTCLPLRRAATAVLAVALVAGCSGPEPITADSAIFDGLDPAAVTETLANAHATGWIESQPEDERESTAQLMARDLQQCRAAVADLGAWTDGWSADSLHLIIPDDPLQPGNESALHGQELLVGLVETQGRDGSSRG